MSKYPIVDNEAEDIFRKYIDELPITHYNKEYIKGIEVVLEDYSSFVLDGKLLVSDVDIDRSFSFCYWPKQKAKPIGIKVLIDTDKLEKDVNNYMDNLFK